MKLITDVILTQNCTIIFFVKKICVFYRFYSFVCVVSFWQKEFGWKAACKMLVNLTKGLLFYLSLFFSFWSRNKFGRKNLNHVQQDSRQGAKLRRSTHDMGWGCRFVALTKLLRKTGVLYFVDRFSILRVILAQRSC